MKKVVLRIFPIVFILLIQTNFSFAQTDTSLIIDNNNPSFISKQIVPAGAGIAILTTNLVYYFKPQQNFHPFKKNKELTITPIITTGTLAIHCRI
jgi:hypothetical protein